MTRDTESLFDRDDGRTPLDRGDGGQPKRHDGGSSDTSGLRADAAGIALAVVLAATAMAPTLRGTFLPGDDEHFVRNHSCVNRPGLANAIRLFGMVHRDLYQPVPMVTFALDTAVYGDRAWGFHLTNVLWHVLATILVWWLVRLRWQRWGVATLAAALFAVHPQAIEAVATVTDRIVEMGVTFSLAATAAFLIWSKRRYGEAGWLAAAILFALLAMMSKVQPALPVLLLIVVYGQQQRSTRAWWSAWGALCGITVAFTALALWTTSQTGLVVAAQAELPGTVVGRALLAIGIYLTHFVWPVGLSTWYLPPATWTWSQPLLWFGAAGLIGLLATAWICRSGRAATVAIGLVWYAIAILPMLAASSARNLIAADRYTYLANVGLFVAVAAAALLLFDRYRERIGKTGAAVLVSIPAAGAALALMLTSWAQAGHYRTGLAYYQRVAALYPHAPWAQLNVGWELVRAGRLDEAERAAHAELDNPHGDRNRTQQLLGTIAEKRGQLDVALRHFQTSADALPDDATAQYQLGRLLQKLRRFDQASHAYQQALKSHPGHLPSLLGLASAYEALGRLAPAAEALDRVIQISPQHVEARTRLATLKLRQGDRAGAERLYCQVLETDPDCVPARINLAAILAQSNRQAEALRHYNRVIEQAPGSVSARLNRASLLQGWGRNAEAAEDYRQILMTDPGCVPALKGMHEILLAIRPRDGAQRAARMWADAVRKGGRKPPLLAGLAWAQASAGMDDPAEQTARECLKDDPHQVLAHLTVGLVALHRQQAGAAVDAVERACAHATSAIADDLDRAARVIGAYGMQHRREPLPYYLLGRIMLARNDRTMAQRAFDELKRISQDPIWQTRIRQATARGAAGTPATREPTTSSRPTTTRGAKADPRRRGR